jgi:hypothetical protein
VDGDKVEGSKVGKRREKKGIISTVNKYQEVSSKRCPYQFLISKNSEVFS